MKSKSYRSIAILIVGLMVPFAVVGCGLMDSHVKQFDLENGMGAEVLKRISDGGMGNVSAAGQGIEPGLTFEAGMKYYASAYYKGLSGQFMINANGQLTKLTPEQEATVDKIIRDKGLSDEQKRTAILGLVNKAGGLIDKAGDKYLGTSGTTPSGE